MVKLTVQASLLSILSDNIFSFFFSSFYGVYMVDLARMGKGKSLQAADEPCGLIYWMILFFFGGISWWEANHPTAWVGRDLAFS